MPACVTFWRLGVLGELESVLAKGMTYYRMYYYSLITSFDLSNKQDPRYQHLLGRLTSAVGYQPTLASELGSFQERITSTRNGSITSIQAVYVPADDMTDPAPATTFIHLDATTVLFSFGRISSFAVTPV